MSKYKCTKKDCIYNMSCEFTTGGLDTKFEKNEPICLGGEDVSMQDLEIINDEI